MIEYGLMVGLIAVVSIPAVTIFGGSVKGLFTMIAASL
jgi:Flp pilus assembly pilin Flp